MKASILLLLLFFGHNAWAQALGFSQATLDVGVVSQDTTLSLSAEVYGINRQRVHFTVTACCGITDYDTGIDIQNAGPATLTFKFKPGNVICIGDEPIGITLWAGGQPLGQQGGQLWLTGFAYPDSLLHSYNIEMGNRKVDDSIILNLRDEGIVFPSQKSSVLRNVDAPFYGALFRPVSCFYGSDSFPDFTTVMMLFHPTEPGKFVDSANLILDDSDTIVLVLEGTATGADVASDAAGDPVRLFPNPCSDELHIAVDQKWSKYVVSVWDLLGNEVRHEEESEPSTAIKTSELVNGIYWIQIVAGNWVTRRPLLIQHSP